MGIFMRAFKEYLDFVLQNSDIYKAQQNLNEAFMTWQPLRARY